MVDIHSFDAERLLMALLLIGSIMKDREAMYVFSELAPPPNNSSINVFIGNGSITL